MELHVEEGCSVPAESILNNPYTYDVIVEAGQKSQLCQLRDLIR